MWNEIRHFTFAKQIFHSGAISHGKAIFHSPKANFVEKSTHCLGRQCVLFSGLPEWIRTIDLQSRSLTRYPAVPRADGNTLCCNEIWLRQVKSLCDEIFATQMWNVCQGKRGKFHFTSTTSRYFTMVHHFTLWKSISLIFMLSPKSIKNYITEIYFCKLFY